MSKLTATVALAVMSGIALKGINMMVNTANSGDSTVKKIAVVAGSTIAVWKTLQVLKPLFDGKDTFFDDLIAIFER